MPSYNEKHRGGEPNSGRRSQDITIAGRFRIQERLGGGAFGEVFSGKDLTTGRPVAFKMELTKDGQRSHLNLEYKIYKRFNECPVTVGIPQVFYCGVVGDYTVMVMDLLGPCLEDLYNICHRNFSPKTVCMLGVQIVERLQYLHKAGYLHRDIKPENFVMGLGNRSHTVYIIDVGLAKAWRDSSNRHIPYAEGKSLTGTARYVSINTHKGIQQSRRDDLESVSYLLMYFLRGSLPWQGLKSPKNDVHYERIRNVKEETDPYVLAEGYPRQFGDLVSYARRIGFEEEPNYRFCTSLLMSALAGMDETFDYRYQWNVKAQANDSAAERSTHNPVESRRQSRQNTAVATGGSSSLMASSAFLPAGEEGDSAVYAKSQTSSQAYAHFMNEMQDTYGLGDYY